MQAKEVTLFSGGARGAETAFGEAAAANGVGEVHFTFEGHHIHRLVGVRHLSAEELDKVDVVLTEVSRRLKRDYITLPWMRRILQSIGYQINNGFQVFVVGHILPDGTVKGGTGWAAELGKMFNRPLHVYDMDVKGWFTWKNDAWTPDLPQITYKTFCGTGTRNLTPDGEKAIADLFARSFGPDGRLSTEGCNCQ